MLNELQKSLTGLLIIFAFYLGGLLLVHGMGLSIPGSIVGLLGLIALLGLRKGQLPSVRASASVLLPLIPLFLIPICVSMTLTVPLDSARTWKVIGLISVSTIVGVVLTATVTRLLFQASRGCGTAGPDDGRIADEVQR